jgi:hypothetical protein
MTGEGFWTLMGIVAALLGVALLVGVARHRRRGPDSE